jgi:hypothetical protein
MFSMMVLASNNELCYSLSGQLQYAKIRSALNIQAANVKRAMKVLYLMLHTRNPYLLHLLLPLLRFPLIGMHQVRGF